VGLTGTETAATGRVCPGCGASFPPRRSGQRCCSDRCRKRVSRASRDRSRDKLLIITDLDVTPLLGGERGVGIAETPRLGSAFVERAAYRSQPTPGGNRPSPALMMCRACEAMKPATPEAFYVRGGRLIARCRACGMGGVRANAGGTRAGAGRKRAEVPAIAQAVHALVTMTTVVNAGVHRRPLPAKAEGKGDCWKCGRRLSKSRFKVLDRVTGFRYVTDCDNCRAKSRRLKRRAAQPLNARHVQPLRLETTRDLEPRATDILILERWRKDLDTEPDPDLRPRVFRNGLVKVLAVPAYIHPGTVLSLPSPAAYRRLGGVATIENVHQDDDPPHGFYWYVVTGRGDERRLAFWKEANSDPKGDAFVAWWNAGVRAGWSDSLPPHWLDSAGLSGPQIARLDRTPELRRWLKEDAA